ncbi:MAG: hypothetical protein D6807_05790 [Alphaproteobacteria bacterium]|nr:MAG: hypothetical protein D6807_05790 [Alphaproteobacteria bacterium]
MTSPPMTPPHVIGRVVTRYDRFVAFMRIFLPALAVILAGMTFLWPLLHRPETSFVLNKEKLRRGDEEVRIIGPVYRGTDSLGRLFTLAAQEAVQSSPDAPRVALSGMTAEMLLGDGREARVTALAGSYDKATGLVHIPGELRFETSDGYALTAEDAVIDLRAKTIHSDRPVRGRAPLGTISAERFLIDVAARKAVFEGGVRAHTTPAPRGP